MSVSRIGKIFKLKFNSNDTMRSDSEFFEYENCSNNSSTIVCRNIKLNLSDLWVNFNL
jgi:hypothetical protein